MRVRDVAQETLSALDANRGRSALTILGIVIGIAAVIAMTALIGGVNDTLVGELGLSQAQLIYINVWTDRPMTYDDVDRMARDMPDYEYMTAFSFGGGDVTTEEKKVGGSFQGVKPEYFEAMGTKFLQGRPFSEAEIDAESLVVIVDQNAVHTLFGATDAEAVGKTIQIGNDVYTIVGVVEANGVNNSGEESVNGYLPLTTLATRITGSQDIGQIIGVAREGADMDKLVTKTEDYLAKAYNISDENRSNSLYVYSMQSMIDEMNTTMASFSLLMTAVASISLLVGGIGIMNMMLTNVTERIREIGLRKALGAKRFDIVWQFMLESVCLCVVGGLLGVFLGYVGALGLSGLVADAMMGNAGATIKPHIDLGTVILATSICVGIGLVFGWYPAHRAARLDPVESLHYQ